MTPIKPALTAEEWAEALADNDPENMGGVVAYHADYKRLHKAAALALYGQSFGFTRADVATLVEIQEFVYVASIARPELRAWAKGLADRIEALLPPE